MQQAGPKRRRFAKACDECYRRKVACHWQPPACPDCSRKGIDCTFTRVEPRGDDPGQPVASLKAVEDRLRGLEERLRDQVAEQTETSSPGQGDDSTPRDQTRNEVRPEPLPFDLRAAQDRITDAYFDRVNRHCLIFDQMLLQQRRRCLYEGTDDPDKLWLPVCLDLTELAVHQVDSEIDQAEANHLLESILGTVGQNAWASSFLALQTLVLLLTCLKRSSLPHKQDRASRLLALTTRMAQDIDLHVLDTLTEGLSVRERVERIRTFWAIYILDQEFAVRTGKPPLLQDEDIWVTEPRKFSDDGCGLTASAKGDLVLNLFVARQRLARIQARLYRAIFPFKSRLRRNEDLRRDLDNIHAALKEWKKGWFDYGPVDILAETWSKQAISEMVQLHFSYFCTLLNATPVVEGARPECREMFDIFLPFKPKLQVDEEDVPRVCIEASQETIFLARVVRQGELRMLMESMNYVFPALAILLANRQRLSHLEGAESAVEMWLDMVGLIAEKSAGPQLQRAYSLCLSLKEGST